MGASRCPVEAADLKQDACRVCEGVFVGSFHRNAFTRAGDDLPALPAHNPLVPGGILDARLVEGLIGDIAVGRRGGAAAQHEKRLCVELFHEYGSGEVPLRSVCIARCLQCCKDPCDCYIQRQWSAKEYGMLYPRFLEIEITGRCPYRCQHCYGSFPAGAELNTQTVLHLLEQARGHFDCVIFSGGEPLLHPGLADMVDAACGHFVVFITTSGYGLTDKLLSCIHDRAVPVFGLDGIGATHDRYRGSPGAFATLVRGLDMTRGFPKEIIVTLWRDALQEIDRIIAFAEPYSPILHFNNLIPVGRARDNPDILPDIAALTAADAKLHHLKRTTGWIVTDLHRVTDSDRETGIDLFCKGRFNITPTGDVRPCEFHVLVLGNILRQPLPEILAAGRETELIRSREEGFRRQVRADLPNPYDYHTAICHHIACATACGAAGRQATAGTGSSRD